MKARTQNLKCIPSKIYKKKNVLRLRNRDIERPNPTYCRHCCPIDRFSQQMQVWFHRRLSKKRAQDTYAKGYHNAINRICGLAVRKRLCHLMSPFTPVNDRLATIRIIQYHPIFAHVSTLDKDLLRMPSTKSCRKNTTSASLLTSSRTSM